MKSHLCQSCGQSFAITEEIRRADRIFNLSRQPMSYAQGVKNYFMATCPHCQVEQLCPEIKMFWLLNHQNAQLALPAIVVMVVAGLFLADHLR